MTLIALVAVIAAQFAYHLYAERAWITERRRLTELFVARNVGDVVALGGTKTKARSAEPEPVDEDELIGLSGR